MEVSDFESERRERRHKLKTFWEKKLEETAREMEENKGGTDRKEAKERKRETVFRCKEDKIAHTKKRFRRCTGRCR